MGASHSVDLIICINNYNAGTILISSARFHLTAVLESSPIEITHRPSEQLGFVLELFAGKGFWTAVHVGAGFGALTPIEVFK